MATIKVTKLDAARRELRTAIELWFTDGDPVSIHVLAYSAYEILHALARRKGAKDLLFDSSLVKEDKRQELNMSLKKVANFAKHAQKDPDGTIEFSPALSEGFIEFGIIALQASGESLGDEEFAYSTWNVVHYPERFTDDGLKFLVAGLPVDEFMQLRKIPRGQFLKAFLKARRQLGHL